MAETYNIYCDESCHLENDRQEVMVLGAVWCPLDKTREISIRIREYKAQYNMKNNFEIKWSKVSPAKERFYCDIVDYFFDDDDLHFRALIISNKSKLRHEDYQQSHDEWYYKMYFELLKVIIDPKHCYRIYLDIKDTKSASRVRKLRDVLRKNIYDFSRSIIERVQTVRSHEVEILQLADLLIGAISYANRGLSDNAGKKALVERMRKRSTYQLTRTTLLRENKLNLFRWLPSERQP